MKNQQQLSEMAAREYLYNYDYQAFQDSYVDGYIKGYQAAQEDMKWIDCSERLPENKSKCLVFERPHIVGASFHDNDGFYDENGFELLPSHWQPLPQKPLMP